MRVVGEMDEALTLTRWERLLRWLLGLPPYTTGRCRGHRCR
ncbi:MAG TPA: hypothetical protein VH008_26205 [Pseudonocardia sp.]|nr:hypothetical protein [Pseudonocardia sp.]